VIILRDLRDLGNPPDFWEYFEKISKIPRCSGKEEKVREFIKTQAEIMSFETLVDKGGNLIIRIPSKLKANNSKIILQCHMDMVCEKNEKIRHDFSKDSLKLSLIERDNEKWLTAEGTTLGADNGVGIAYLLTLMKKIYHGELELGPLDFLFTVDEEIGLVGANNLDSGLIDGKYLLNLDSEDDERFTIGCAGGVNTIGTIKVEFVGISDDTKNLIPLKLSITGLIGGHSGVDIHRGRANALKILTKILWKVNNTFSIELNSINGGNRPNAIPREAQAIFYVDKQSFDEINNLITQIISEIKREYSTIEPKLNISAIKISTIEKSIIIPSPIKDKILHILYIIQNGPVSMDQKIPKLVHTSTNLASVRTEDSLIKIVTSQRSLSEASLKNLYEKIESLFNMANLDCEILHEGEYPGWEPNFNSNLLNIAKETYGNLFNQKPIIEVIHAGLECGILKKKFPNMEMISFGPTIIGPHSPDERVNIISVEKIWRFLVALLKNLN
jgi:dipeptidase D